ncbi:hypothetical protein XPN_2483, partial [Xanthomonas arboricola pv. pruni MAFF 301427]
AQPRLQQWFAAGLPASGGAWRWQRGARQPAAGRAVAARRRQATPGIERRPGRGCAQHRAIGAGCGDRSRTRRDAACTAGLADPVQCQRPAAARLRQLRMAGLDRACVCARAIGSGPVVVHRHTRAGAGSGDSAAALGTAPRAARRRRTAAARRHRGELARIRRQRATGLGEVHQRLPLAAAQRAVSGVERGM